MARLRPGQKKRVPLHKDYAKGLKSLGKKALKATPPGMMLTAAQKIKEEFNRLTKPKKPGGRAPSTKRPKKSDPKAPKKPRDIMAPPKRPKVKKDPNAPKRPGSKPRPRPRRKM